MQMVKGQGMKVRFRNESVLESKGWKVTNESDLDAKGDIERALYLGIRKSHKEFVTEECVICTQLGQQKNDPQKRRTQTEVFPLIMTSSQPKWRTGHNGSSFINVTRHG